ncbi:MAG: hypothetical protein HZB91_10615 [Elusimicrobia bacterium]|nr:hypothetical protein [Elusimicrobiota bacterium]
MEPLRAGGSGILRLARGLLLPAALLAAPGVRAATVSGVTLTAVGPITLGISWTIPATSTPTIVLGQDNFQVIISSGLGNLGESAATFSNLVPNTTYWFEVKNSTEDDAAYVSFNAVKSTSTLAAAPGVAAFSGVTESAIRANWSWAGNGPGVLYEALLSAAASPSTNGLPGNKSSATFETFAVFSAGLGVNTTYYAEVRAVNNNGIPTAYADLGSTATLANAPTSASPSAIAVDRLTANWGPNSNPGGTRYLAQLSADSGFSPVAASSVTAENWAIFTGLGANTTYYARAASLNSLGGASAFTGLPSTSTLAAAPAASAFSGVTASAVRANWSWAGNGPGVLYEALLSAAASPSTNGLPGNKSSATFETFGVFSAGLGVNTTYYAEVRAVNNNGIPTAYADLGSTATLANAPTSALPSAIAVDRLTANWGPNSNPGGTRYLAQLSADSGFSPVAASSVTAENWAIFTGLGANTTYYARAASLNSLGGASAFTGLPSTSTLALAPVASAFSKVDTSSIQVNWTSGGGGPGARYEAVLSSAASPSSNGLSGNKSSSTFNTFAVFTGLSLTADYHAAVRAVNNNGLPTAYTSLGSTRTAASSQSVAPGSAQTIVLYAASGEIRVEVPAAAFDSAVQIVTRLPAGFPASDGAATGVGVEITLVPEVQPENPVTLSIGYGGALLPAGTDETRLIIARHDPLRGVWVPLVSKTDTSAKEVTAEVNHLSTFQLMQASANSDLSRVKAFPVPLRPNQGQSSMTFINLPAGARLRFFDFQGRRIRDLSADNAGMAAWNGRSGEGQPAASGVYVVLIESGGAKRTFKVAVER